MRYEVVTWSPDIGAKSHGGFNRKSDAEKSAKTYKNSEEFAAVYDYKTNCATVIFGLSDPFSDSVTVYFRQNEKNILYRKGK